MKICAVGAELLHADSRTDKQTNRHDEAIVAFPSFVNEPKKVRY